MVDPMSPLPRSRARLLPPLLSCATFLVACGGGTATGAEQQPTTARPAPVAASLARCGGFVDTPAGMVAPLQGRFQMSLIPGMELAPLGADNIMAAPPSEAVLGRASGESAGVTLFMMTREMFSRPTAETDTRAASVLGPLTGRDPDEMERATVQTASGVRVWAAQARTPRAVQGVTTVLAALVDPGDGYLVFVGFGVVGQSQSEIPGCAARARAMLSTIRPGSRSIVTGAGTRTLDEGDSAIIATVPEGWAHSVERGPDFVVHYLQEISDFDAPAALIGVYRGGHPSFDRPPVQPETRTTLGVETEWFVTPDPDGTTRSEALIPDPSGYGSIHIFARSPERSHAAMWAVIDSLRVP